MDLDQAQRSRPGLRPVVGVVMVLGLVTLLLGAGLLVRQAGTHPLVVVADHSPGLDHTPGAQVREIAAAPGSTAAPEPTSTTVLAVAIPAATGTPTIKDTGPVGTVAAQPAAPLPVQTPRPRVIGTRQTPSQPTEAVAALPTSVSVAEAGDAALSEPDRANSPSSATGESYTGLPVAVPTTAVLDGVELPVGPAGVQSDGARAFAQALLSRARAQDVGLVDDPALREVAEHALLDHLTVSTPTGRVVPTRLRQGSVTVQIDIVATLPSTTGASLRLSPSASVPAIGVAVGVAGRIEPDYLPDLVAVAAVAYR